MHENTRLHRNWVHTGRALLAAALPLFLTVLQVSTAEARVLLIPKDTALPPLALESQHVTVTFDNNVARTKVDQVFVNNTARDLEATYVFPLPKGATISDFALYINGERTKGEVLKKDKARSIYEGIVARMQDPGLLEYLGNDLFKARVFPVPARGKQRVEIAYVQALSADAGLARYTYPLKALEGSPPQSFSLEIAATSAVPLKTLYSPTHDIEVLRPDEHTARASYEDEGARPDRDLVLYLGASARDVAANLLCSRIPGEDGYFLLMLSPNAAVDDKKVAARDICFVLDTSGSMNKDGKIDQARKALSFCISKLNEGDRFNVLQFATDVEGFEKKLVPRTAANVTRAQNWIDGLDALGGTAIDEALQKALSMRPGGDERPYTIVFITDGKPTVGETNPDGILRNIEKAISAGTRIFTFGVGTRLNTRLLDSIAADHGGAAAYVTPGEDIEVEVGSFYTKIRHPVLTGVSLDFGGAEVSTTYPSELPDLYAGSQLTVLGRYRKPGKTTLTLSGKLNGKEVTRTYDVTFAEEERERGFVPRLWAVRRVGHLLETIRRSGESDEVVEEIVTLGKKYSIVTPYTSFLVVEDEPLAQTPMEPGDVSSIQPVPMRPFTRDGFPRYAPEADAFGGRAGGASAAAPAAGPTVTSLVRRKTEPAFRSRSSYVADRESLRAEEGARAVATSQKLREMKEANTAAEVAPVAYKVVGSRSFNLEDGVWVQVDLPAKAERLKVKYASRAYFDILSARPDLKDVFALGTRVVVLVGQTILEVAPDGEEALSPEALNALVPR